MSRPGACDGGGCAERLLLVRAATVEALACAEAEVLAAIAALRPLLDEILTSTAPPQGWEAAYEALQTRARSVLGRPVADRVMTYLSEEPASAVTAWWCDRCYAIDAPQPCLGICVWRSVEWTRYDAYRELRQRAISEKQAEQRMRALLWRIVHTVPHTGRHREAWLAFASAAENALGESMTRENYAPAAYQLRA